MANSQRKDQPPIAFQH
ncbi:hypothetical protein C370_07254 [Cryptococcus neoformans A1-35-8]|nr:hypothetical protein C369_07455 [Cryptococcus neoformans var. grubii A5-35-17]OXH01326.1 hypothetical protein C370_07254 [Cryptococcus neoformans var. grubii A1-35-8]